MGNNPFEYKMCIVLRMDLEMSTGKLIAQAAHAAVGASEIGKKENHKAWRKWNHEGAKKVALEAESLEELKELREKGNSYMVMIALPKCLFGFDYDRITTELKIPKSCRDCAEMFSLQKNGMIKFCGPMKNKIGPKLEYMRDRNQIFDYFWTFYEKLKPSTKCESCLYFLRRQCTGICLRHQ